MQIETGKIEVPVRRSRNGKYATPVKDFLNSEQPVLKITLESVKEACACVGSILALKKRNEFEIDVSRKSNVVYVVNRRVENVDTEN